MGYSMEWKEKSDLLAVRKQLHDSRFNFFISYVSWSKEYTIISHISWSKEHTSIHGSLPLEETALVLRAQKFSEPNTYLILRGDFRKEYEAAYPDYKKCLKVFEDNPESVSFFSDCEPPSDFISYNLEDER